MQHRIQKIQCIFDLFTCFAWIGTVAVNLHYGRVSSDFFCQLQGTVLLFFATGNFTTITYGVYNRYYYLGQLKDNKTPNKDKPPPHERIYFIVLVLLLIHALLPVMTSATYGIYFPKPSNATCFASGGRGIFAHDIFGFISMLHFLGNTALIIFASYQSLKIIKTLLSASVQSTASGKKQAEAERRAALLAIVTTLLFLVCRG